MDIPASHRHCPVGHVTALLGDRWSMLIVREALLGVERFGDFRDALTISEHTLTRRLVHLQDVGVVRRDGAARGRYHLTDAGRDLARVMAVLGDWALTWLTVDEPLRQPPVAVVEAADALGLETSRR